MKKYRVKAESVQRFDQYYDVYASSKEDAIKRVKQGQATYTYEQLRSVEHFEPVDAEAVTQKRTKEVRLLATA